MRMVRSYASASHSLTMVDTIFESSVTFAENLFKQITGVLPKTSDPSSCTVKRTFTRDLCDCEKFDKHKCYLAVGNHVQKKLILGHLRCTLLATGSAYKPSDQKYNHNLILCKFSI